MRKSKEYLIALLLTILLVMIDQFTKQLAIVYLKNEDIVILKNVFRLTYHENTGSAFGILQGFKKFLLLSSTVLAIGIIYLYARLPYGKKFTPLKVCAIFVLSGALGNIIDRINHSFVVDFFYFELVNFPVFNVADVYITVSMAALCFLILIYYKEEECTYILNYIKGKAK